MKTTVLRKMEYKGTFIGVLTYNFTFQYLFAWNNEVYRQEVYVVPSILSLRRWAWKLGLVDFPYPHEDLARIEQAVLSGAMKSIDLLEQDKSGDKRRKAEKVAKKKGKCLWQARSDAVGTPIYICLTHNKFAPFEDNPRH